MRSFSVLRDRDSDFFNKGRHDEDAVVGRTVPEETGPPVKLSEVLPVPEGITPQLKQIYQMLSKSTDGFGLAKFAIACQRIGTALFDVGDPAAYDYLRQSATKYREAMAMGFDFPDPIAEQILYKEACVYAKEGNNEAALKSLEEAVGRGYSKFDEAKQDPDLASLGDLTEKFKAWQAAVTPPKAEGVVISSKLSTAQGCS